MCLATAEIVKILRIHHAYTSFSHKDSNTSCKALLSFKLDCGAKTRFDTSALKHMTAI